MSNTGKGSGGGVLVKALAALAVARVLRTRIREYRADPSLVRAAPGGTTAGGAPGGDASTAKAAHDPHGRTAAAPTEFSLRAWLDVFWRVYAEIDRDRLLSVAAGVTFYGLLAIFPGIAALVSVYSLIADPVTINAHLANLAGVLPAGTLDIIGEQVTRLTAQDNDSLGLGLIVGLAVSLWSANAGMKAIFDALNVVYEEREKRGFIKLNALSLAFTLAGILGAILVFTVVVVTPVVLSFVGLGGVTEFLIQVFRWPIIVALVLVALAVLYRFGPSRKQARWRWVSPGSLLAAGLWLIVSILFSWYVSNFADYNATYGSLGAVIGLITWMWLSTAVVLLGGELNAELEHQTAVDTTTGPPEPMGQRGARMADTVAPAGDKKKS